MTKRRLRLALVLVLAAAWTWIPAAHAQPAGELRVALPWTPENLDPTMNLASIRAAVGVSLFDSLVGRDADNRIVPQLAESWKLLDELTWQFKLRRGVVYKNDKVDQLLDQARATMDAAKRRKAYADLGRAMVEDATWVYLMQQVDIYAARDRLTWTPRADQWLLFHEAVLK